MRKAGPLPAPDAEPVMLLAWLSAAGYGRACLASFKTFLRWRELAASGTIGGYRRRGKVREYTAESFRAQGTAFGIVYPGVVRDEKKRKQFDAAGSRRPFRRDPDARESTIQFWRDGWGLYVSAAIKAHGGRPSTSEVREVTDTAIILNIYNGARWIIERIPTRQREGADRWPRYRGDSRSLSERYHLGARPLPLP
jgi:hypothetical protein